MEQTANATRRNRQLDGLRGYAAVMVAIFHSILGIDSRLIERVLSPSLLTFDNGYDRALKIALALFNGESAVVVFFVMSGAVLVESLRRDPAPVGTLALGFLMRRVLRIYPVLIVCLVIAAIFFPLIDRPDTFKAFWINLSLYDFVLLGASWTLNVEVLATPFILIGGLILIRWKEWGLLAFTVAVLFTLKAPVLANFLQSFKGFAFCFALGMFVPTRWGAFAARWTPRWGWIVFLLLLLFSRHIPVFGPKSTANIQQVSAGLLVNALYYDVAHGLGAALRAPVSNFFGRISYTFYLGNVLVLEPVIHWLSSQAWAVARPLEIGLVASLVVIGFGVPIAYALTVTVEEPAIRFGRRWSQRLSDARETRSALPSP